MNSSSAASRAEQESFADELEYRVAQRTAELQLIWESIPGLVALLSPTGEVEVVNRQLLDYFGQSLEELRQWGTNGTVHPVDLAHVIDVFSRSIASGIPYEIEQRLRRADGVYRWLHNSGFPIRDAQGKIMRWCVLLTDIDERKRAEAQLAGEKRLLGMVASGCAVTDVLTELCKFVEDIDSDCRCGIYLIDRPPLLQTHWFTPIYSRDGQVLGTFAIFRDNPASPTQSQLDLIAQVTHIASIAIEHDLDEKSLRRTAVFLEQAQQLSRTGSFSWRIETDEITWSDQLYTIYELDPATAITLELIRTRVHPEDLTLYEKMVEQARNGAHDFEWQYRLLMPDKSIKHMHAVAHATRNHEGQLEYIAAVQDVTARRQSEEALDKARSELGQVARVMSLGVLTASIAHEVNQPLSGIITNASTCMRMLETEPPNVDGARETARRAIRDGRRAADVITRLRALFTNKDTAAELFDLNEATREVIALSRSELERNGVITQTELAPDLPAIKGDRVQLQQVILNLLRNGSDAMSDIVDRPRLLLFRTELEEGARVRLSVRDAGTGLKQQSMGRLFEAFYSTKEDGMGIGLSVSRSIIENHQGRLWATPNDGPGVTFSFSIPGVIDE